MLEIVFSPYLFAFVAGFRPGDCFMLLTLVGCFQVYDLCKHVFVYILYIYIYRNAATCSAVSMFWQLAAFLWDVLIKR